MFGGNEKGRARLSRARPFQPQAETARLGSNSAGLVLFHLEVDMLSVNCLAQLFLVEIESFANVGEAKCIVHIVRAIQPLSSAVLRFPLTGYKVSYCTLQNSSKKTLFRVESTIISGDAVVRPELHYNFTHTLFVRG